MKKEISQKAMNIIKKMQRNELNESFIYKNIAKFAKGEENKKILNRLGDEEYAHYEIWKEYTGIEMKPNKLKILKYKLMARIFGFTFAVKLMENGEEIAQGEYEVITSEVKESEYIKKQEEEHEAALLEMIDEERLHYIGSMVLGMNDALVELTGSLAGFTFALQNTRTIAMAGLIMGISATFSMASSEFLAAKSEGRTDAFKSCCYTGVAYLVTVALLILPYLLLDSAKYMIALFVMIGIVVLIIAGFTYYISVAKGERFRPKFLEMTLISVGVAVVSFFVGILAKHFLGVDL